MFRPRIIPVLLIRDQALVKSVAFKDFRYIGDPINAVRIFNEMKTDELVFLDIQATKENRLISLDFVRKVGEEADMPFAVGGGIRTIEDIRNIIGAGAEKVIINSFAAEDPDFIQKASETFGSSCIVVCIDVKKKMFSGMQTWIYNGSRSTGRNPVNIAKLMEEKGAGEIIIQSIEKDGMMNGYDIDLIRTISEAVSIPVIALGGARNLDDMKIAYNEGFANGLAAGSMFVYYGNKKAVLINYPKRSELFY
jgi:imidazole glycerol-phosphate synthase subunit HisF